jgi:hypothetical protein
MGFKDYFRNKPTTPKPAVLHSEKVPEAAPLGPIPELVVPSATNSTSGLISSRSSTYIDDIKHEVMVNYLHQQQCAQMWIAPSAPSIDSNARVVEEGVVLRKSRGNYMSCPSNVAKSVFAHACTALNVQVCSLNLTAVDNR